MVEFKVCVLTGGSADMDDSQEFYGECVQKVCSKTAIADSSEALVLKIIAEAAWQSATRAERERIRQAIQSEIAKLARTGHGKAQRVMAERIMEKIGK